MNKIVFNYILNNFLKSFLIVLIVIFSFGIILNLFEEIEFFKNLNVSILKPLILTSIFVPSLILKLLPFIVFISSMWYMHKIKNNNDLLILKIYGFSNLKIFFIVALTSFALGWVILTLVSPITSSMLKYYEKTKSQYARDIDNLLTFNKNGLWIKEPINNGIRIISADKIEDVHLKNAKIFVFDKNFELNSKVFSKSVNIETNYWDIKDAIVFNSIDGILVKSAEKNFKIKSSYNHERIITLFNNSDTISFIDLVLNYENLLNQGYNENFLNQNFHTMLSLPFFLFLMTALASVFTLYSQKKTENIKLIILAICLCVIIYYLKDFSLALGKTDRIPLVLSIWAPVIALSLFTFIGVLQINEK